MRHRFKLMKPAIADTSSVSIIACKPCGIGVPIIVSGLEALYNRRPGALRNLIETRVEVANATMRNLGCSGFPKHMARKYIATCSRRLTAGGAK